ncbi:MAG: hypothetical protein V1782_08005, partial [Pseudomonadota bacterium]
SKSSFHDYRYSGIAANYLRQGFGLFLLHKGIPVIDCFPAKTQTFGHTKGMVGLQLYAQNPME